MCVVLHKIILFLFKTILSLLGDLQNRVTDQIWAAWFICVLPDEKLNIMKLLAVIFNHHTFCLDLMGYKRVYNIVVIKKKGS